MSAGRISIEPSAGTRQGGGQSPVGRFRPILEHIILGKPLGVQDPGRERDVSRLLERFGEVTAGKNAGDEGKAIIHDLASRIRTPIVKLTLERLITLAENVPEKDLRRMLADARVLMNENHSLADAVPRIMENTYGMLGGRYLGLQATRKMAVVGSGKAKTGCPEDISGKIRIEYESGGLDGIEKVAEVRAQLALEGALARAEDAKAAASVGQAAPDPIAQHQPESARAQESFIGEAAWQQARALDERAQQAIPDPSQYAQLSGINRLKGTKEETGSVPDTAAEVPLRVADYFRSRRNAESTRKLAKAAAPPPARAEVQARQERECPLKTSSPRPPGTTQKIAEPQKSAAGGLLPALKEAKAANAPPAARDNAPGVRIRTVLSRQPRAAVPRMARRPQPAGLLRPIAHAIAMVARMKGKDSNRKAARAVAGTPSVKARARKRRHEGKEERVRTPKRRRAREARRERKERGPRASAAHEARVKSRIRKPNEMSPAPRNRKNKNPRESARAPAAIERRAKPVRVGNAAEKARVKVARPRTDRDSYIVRAPKKRKDARSAPPHVGASNVRVGSAKRAGRRGGKAQAGAAGRRVEPFTTKRRRNIF